MPNQLIHEKSPYLLQHAHNPVDWYPWGEAAFEKARNENKPVLVSIGYAACHWCHVMERESFENEDVAAFMNEHFVCIKVDREEHPDVDHFYMDALQAISGSGGWPLNMFATPQKAPFYGGTYFPPVQAYGRVSWMQLLQRIKELWDKQKNDVQLQADQMIKHLTNVASSVGKTQNEQALDEAFCRKLIAGLLENADTTDGGFGRAPKFPATMSINFLLEAYQYCGDKAALYQALHSLDKMLQGGIYDQVGGGFARYSVDDKWLVPHFEKMLYDNALLISALSNAYMVSPQKRYKAAIEETIAFVERELKDASGVYYSAIDADSEGVEGKFYTWTKQEWDAAVGHGNNASMVAEYYDVSEQGNWEHTNILNTPQLFDGFVEQNGLDAEDFSKMLNEIKNALFSVRSGRVRPITDDKSLLSWNALMNIALTTAGVALGNQAYIERAVAHAEAMLQLFTKDGLLMHTWKQGVAKIAANLDDYAYLIQSLLQIGSISGNIELVVRAERLMEACLARFSTAGSSLLFFSDEEKGIPVRKVETYDGAVPSANAIHVHNLILLSFITERQDWRRLADDSLWQMKQNTLHYPSAHSYWAMLMQRSAIGWKLVVCTGEAGKQHAHALLSRYRPNAFILTFQKQISEYAHLRIKFLMRDSFIFVCNETECLPPVSSIEAAATLLEKS